MRFGAGARGSGSSAGSESVGRVQRAAALGPHRNRTRRDLCQRRRPRRGQRDGQGVPGVPDGAADRSRDLVLIDHRGTGHPERSTVPGCSRGHRRLRHRRRRGVRAQLGKDADRYGSGDVAMDMEAVRQALGYPRIALRPVLRVGGPRGVRDAVPAPPARAGYRCGAPGHRPPARLDLGSGHPAGLARGAALACDRAPACAAAHPQAGPPWVGWPRPSGRDRFGDGRSPGASTVPWTSVLGADRPRRASTRVSSRPRDRLGPGRPAPLLRLGAEATPGEPRIPPVFS